MAAAAATPRIPRPFQSRLGPGGRGLIAAYLIAVHSDREAYKALLQALEARANKQVGSAPGNKGTTSVAMKGLAPKILGVALENGAVNREANGTVLTFRATPAGVVKALQNKELADIFADYSRSSFQRYAGRISVAASFDVSKGPNAGTFAADEHQLTNWSVRGELFNQRDPAAAEYATLWNGLLRTSAPYSAAVNTLDLQMSAWPEYVTWESQLLAEIERVVEKPLSSDPNGNIPAAGGRFRALLEPALAKLEKLPNMPPGALKALDGYVAELSKQQSGIDNVYNFVAKGSLLTADWSTTRDASLPDLYAATVIWEYAFGAVRKTDLTVNGAVSFYRRKPTPEGDRLKSVDLTASIDRPLGAVLLLPKTVLTVAGRYSYVPNDSVAAAPAAAGNGTATVPMTAPKGHIGLLQLKLTIPVKDSGIKVPLSITASNRTELIKEKDVRASFGVTFDLDALASGLFQR